MGEYSTSDPFGIRSMPYDAYNRTYGDVVGAEVHMDGEVYAAIGWRLLEPTRPPASTRACCSPTWSTA